MHVLVDHLRALAENRLGTGAESPLDPGVACRSEALRGLAELLEDEPALVRPAVRRTIEEQVLEPLPGDPQPPVAKRAAALLAAYGWDGGVGVADHLRFLDRLAGALVHDVWDMVRSVGDVGMTWEDYVVVLGLHAFEAERALAGADPGPEYFLRRPSLSVAERRETLERTIASSRSVGT